MTKGSAEGKSLAEQLVPALTDMLAHLRRAAEQITSLNGIHAAGISPRAIGAGASIKLSTSANTLRGWSLRETSGVGTLVVRFRDGVDAGGDILATISIAAGTSKEAFPTHGIAYTTGLYCEVIPAAGGLLEGVAYLGPIGK